MTINAGPRLGKFSIPLIVERKVTSTINFVTIRANQRKNRRASVRRGNATRSGRHQSVTGLGGEDG